MTLKFYTSVAERLKLKVRKVCDRGGLFTPPPLFHILNRVKENEKEKEDFQQYSTESNSSYDQTI